MSKKLICALVLPMLLAGTEVSAALVTVDINLTTKTEFATESTPSSTVQIRNDVTSINPPTYQIQYGVEFGNGSPVFSDNGTDFSYYNFSAPLSGVAPVGPFFQQLMSTVDTSQYQTIDESSAFFINSFVSHLPGASPGFEGIQVDYQLSGSTTVVENGIQTNRYFTYFALMYIYVGTVNSFDEFTMTSNGSIQQQFANFQGSTAIFDERLSVEVERFDATSGEWLSRSEEGVHYVGNAIYSVTGTISEPGVASLFLVGGVMLTLRKRRNKNSR